MAQMAVTQLWTLEAIAASSTATSVAIDISKGHAFCVHVTALTGTGPDVAFTYSLGCSADGTFVTPAAPVTIAAHGAGADVLDFAPEAASFIKIIATNNNAAQVATVTAQLAVQEL